jgi:hypothetical protein
VVSIGDQPILYYLFDLFTNANSLTAGFIGTLHLAKCHSIIDSEHRPFLIQYRPGAGIAATVDINSPWLIIGMVSHTMLMEEIPSRDRGLRGGN